MIFKAHLVLLRGFLNFLVVFLQEYLGKKGLALEKEALAKFSTKGNTSTFKSAGKGKSQRAAWTIQNEENPITRR